MEERRVEIVRKGFDVFNRQGPQAFIDFLTSRDMIHADFLFHVQRDLPNGGDWRGIEGFHRTMQSWLEAWEEFEVIPHEFAPLDDDSLIVPVRQRAIARGSGVEVSGEFCYAIIFGDRRIAEVRLYADRGRAEAAARSLGESEAGS